MYMRPESLENVRTHYCAGCGHGIIHKLLAECLDELEIRQNTILVAPVGCAVLAYKYINVDGLEAAHGRAPAVATGLKRARPENIVISYQGDGDLLAIGAGETLHTANRGENLTVIFVNNAIYGMTGGQMAPTTLEGQKTLTSPYGRNAAEVGFPIRACEMLDTLEAPAYIERTSVHNPGAVRKTKKAIRKALEYQISGAGYSFVEVLSMCPTNWGVDPVTGASWVKDAMIPWFPLKKFRDRPAENAEKEAS
ncbi:MAG: thiamine pyrophosphate-dependent enzyme [Spirochaetales bacterium]|nr:thiamine pyrophosphate-dependent enzyme [Spirochaetales bacterium]